jgi:hypothetical protein
MKYRSKFEAAVASDLARKLGHPPAYESITVSYRKEYTPDFVLPNGILVECKGHFRATDRAKLLAVLNQHPELDLRIVLQTPHCKLSGTSLTHARWCEKHGIVWSATVVPEDWL